MGERVEFKANFPLFVLASEPRKLHPVSDRTIIDEETLFATFDIWGDLFLHAFTDHSQLQEFLRQDGNEDQFYAVLCTRPGMLRSLVVMLKRFQSLNVGVVLDPYTPDLRRRVAHCDVLRLT